MIALGFGNCVLVTMLKSRCLRVIGFSINQDPFVYCIPYKNEPIVITVGYNMLFGKTIWCDVICRKGSRTVTFRWRCRSNEITSCAAQEKCGVSGASGACARGARQVDANLIKFDKSIKRYQLNYTRWHSPHTQDTAHSQVSSGYAN